MANIELDDKEMDLVLEALRYHYITTRESLDAYIKASEITKFIEPEFVSFMEIKIKNLDNLMRKFFSTRYNIDEV